MTKATEILSVFDELSSINVNEHTEVKDNGQTKLTYLSWVWAWQQVKKKYPDANYEVRHWDGKPYLYDEALGYMIETTVTIKGESMSMWLPVMDSKNKAMKSAPYQYNTKYGPKTVEPATMFDINTTIMRCIVKNLAMFGLGLYIYAGEDLPEDEARLRKEEDALIRQGKNIDDKSVDEVAALMRQQTSIEAVRIIYRKYPAYRDALAAVGQEVASLLN